MNVETMHLVLVGMLREETQVVSNTAGRIIVAKCRTLLVYWGVIN